MTSESRALNVPQFINEQRFSPYQWGILVTCFLLIAVDTYDVVSIGFVIPVLAQQWGLDKSAFGIAMSAGILGLAFGALMAGPLFERLSPKTVMLGSVFFFGICSLGTATAGSMESLCAWRFFTGIGVGAAVPGAATLMYEYAPARMSSFLVNAIGCGSLVGATLCGVAAAILVPAQGWQSVFILGGALPLALGLFMWIFMPEPLHYMVRKGGFDARISAVLARIAPHAKVQGFQFVLPQSHHIGQGGVAVVVSGPFRWGSLMLWAAYFFATFSYYLLLGWMPSLVQSMGATLQHSTLITVLVTLGGIVGTFLFGWLMDRRDRNLVVASAFAVGALAIYAIGFNTSNLNWVAACIFVAGIGLSGGLLSMSSLAATFYPASARSAGISWMQGMGRFGGILGPLTGAWMLKSNLNLSQVFTVVMAVVLLAAAALWAKRHFAKTNV